MENAADDTRKPATGDYRSCRKSSRTVNTNPQPVQRVWIPKMGSKELRPLGIPPVENRVVEMALRNVIEPIFENEFAEHSYGFRPKLGAKDALRRVVQLLQKGKCWVVDADIKGYFDNIPQDKLLEGALRTHQRREAVLEIIRAIPQARSDGEWQRTGNRRRRALRKER